MGFACIVTYKIAAPLFLRKAISIFILSTYIDTGSFKCLFPSLKGYETLKNTDGKFIFISCKS